MGVKMRIRTVKEIIIEDNLTYDEAIDKYADECEEAIDIIDEMKLSKRRKTK